MEIRLRGITKTYVSQGQTVRALDDVSLTIPANQIFTLVGIRFPQPGSYKFVVNVGDLTSHETPLMVVTAGAAPR